MSRSTLDRIDKADAGKPRWSLLPWRAVAEVVAVLEYGAKKYSVDNWQTIDAGAERYTDAALRHLVAHMQGTGRDKESGHAHLAHAVCSLLFVLWFEQERAK